MLCPLQFPGALRLLAAAPAPRQALAEGSGGGGCSQPRMLLWDQAQSDAELLQAPRTAQPRDVVWSLTQPWPGCPGNTKTVLESLLGPQNPRVSEAEKALQGH